MKIIGITGTLGAGKGTVVDYLVEKKGFKHYSARKFLIQEMEKAGIKVTLENMTNFANELREKNSPSILAEKLFEQAKQDGSDAIIESIRTLGEIEALRKKGDFSLLSVDAHVKIRHERIEKRKSEIDDVTFEEFANVDMKQSQSKDPNKQNLKACIEKANFKLDNSYEFADLYKQINSMLEEIEKEKNEIYTRPTWDEYFMEMTRTVAKRATCNRGRSGCVIAKDKQLLVSGYVGSPIGLPHCDDEGHQFKKTIHEDGSITNHCVRTVHAEQNAICQAAKRGISLEGSTLYCKMTPCRVCAMLIINCGIKKVYCEKKYHTGAESEQMFKTVGIELQYETEELQTYDNMN